MFKCAITKRMSKLGEKQHKVVLQTRDRVYTKWVRNEETNEWEEVFAAKGWEIVKEVNATEKGVEFWNSLTAEEKARLTANL